MLIKIFCLHALIMNINACKWLGVYRFLGSTLLCQNSKAIFASWKSFVHRTGIFFSLITVIFLLEKVSSSHFVWPMVKLCHAVQWVTSLMSNDELFIQFRKEYNWSHLRNSRAYNHARDMSYFYRKYWFKLYWTASCFIFDTKGTDRKTILSIQRSDAIFISFSCSLLFAYTYITRSLRV